MKIIRILIYKGSKYYGVPLCGYDNNMGNKIEYGIPQSVLDAQWKEQQWGDIRNERDIRISDVDWTQTSDAPLIPEKKAEFTAYRQALRDIPQTYDNPDDIAWPTKPTL